MDVNSPKGRNGRSQDFDDDSTIAAESGDVQGQGYENAYLDEEYEDDDYDDDDYHYDEQPPPTSNGHQNQQDDGGEFGRSQPARRSCRYSQSMSW